MTEQNQRKIFRGRPEYGNRILMRLAAITQLFKKIPILLDAVHIAVN